MPDIDASGRATYEINLGGASNLYRARLPVFARNVVLTSHPLAAQAGLRMLWQGGNAVDAALTASALQCVIEPHNTGIGGDCFALVALRGIALPVDGGRSAGGG